MTHRKITGPAAAVLLLLVCLAFSACGPTRTYWGVESEYNPDNTYYYRPHYYGHQKPPKPPKHKKYKQKKHKKHHHHDRDWDDD